MKIKLLQGNVVYITLHHALISMVAGYGSTWPSLVVPKYVQNSNQTKQNFLHHLPSPLFHTPFQFSTFCLIKNILNISDLGNKYQYNKWNEQIRSNFLDYEWRDESEINIKKTLSQVYIQEQYIIHQIHLSSNQDFVFQNHLIV